MFLSSCDSLFLFQSNSFTIKNCRNRMSVSGWQAVKGYHSPSHINQIRNGRNQQRGTDSIRWNARCRCGYGDHRQGKPLHQRRNPDHLCGCRRTVSIQRGNSFCLPFTGRPCPGTPGCSRKIPYLIKLHTASKKLCASPQSFLFY